MTRPAEFFLVYSVPEEWWLGLDVRVGELLGVGDELEPVRRGRLEPFPSRAEAELFLQRNRPAFRIVAGGVLPFVVGPAEPDLLALSRRRLASP